MLPKGQFIAYQCNRGVAAHWAGKGMAVYARPSDPLDTTQMEVLEILMHCGGDAFWRYQCAASENSHSAGRHGLPSVYVTVDIPVG